MHFGKKEKPIIISEYGKRRRSFFRNFNMPDTSDNKTIQFLEKYSLIVHAILSLILIFVIEWISRRSFTSAISFVGNHPLVFLYNALLIFVTLLIPYLFRHRGFFRLVISVFWLLLGTINGFVLASRVTPFNFTDLKLIGDLMDMKNSKYISVGQEIIIIIALILLVLFLILFFFKGPFYKKKIHRLRNLIFLGIAIAAIPFITKGAINTGILAGYFGNLAQGYSDYGFVYSFTASVVDTGMSKPVNYSESSVKMIQDSIKTDETALAKDEMPNIIFVQLESFIDPTEINFLKMSDDPVPNYRYLMENYTSGHLTVPVVGAGTANTEFEVLTGMGIQFFGLGEYPYKTVLKSTNCESAASDLEDIGYGTHAIHNNGGNFYGRANVFANMGFDTYTCKEMMNIRTYNEIGSWPTDDILIGETAKALDSTPDKTDFVYTITVQSHGSYPEEKVFENPAIKVSGAETEEKNNQWEYFVNEVYEVDQFIGDLIEELSQRDEKTIVVLFGDHLPTMGLEDEDMATGNLYQTSYVTWNNFGLEKNDKDVTTYQLMSYITEQIGIHEGTIFKYHQSCMGLESLKEKTYLQSLKMLQYDMLYGERYIYNGEDPYPRTELEMGVENVTIDRTYINYDNSKLNIAGENFTPWSKVYVNGEKVTTKFLTDKLLQITLKDLEDGDSIVVNQVGSSETIFRSSNEVFYTAPSDLTDDEIQDSDLEDTSDEDLESISPEDQKLPDAIHDTLKNVDEDHIND